MTKENTFFSLVNDYYSAAFSNDLASRKELFEKTGLNDIWAGSFFTIRAALRAPDPIPFEKLTKRMAYFSNKKIRASLDALIENGYLAADLTATDKATAYLNNYHEAMNTDFGNLEALSEDKMNRMVVLIGKMIEYTLNLENADYPEMGLNLRRTADPNENLQKQVYNQMMLLELFRDDAHVSAWVPSGLEGHEWDTLTAMWKGDVHSAESLSEKFTESRGYTLEEYTAALQILVTRSWAVETAEPGKYKLTEAGEQTRDDAEEKTESNYDVLLDGLSEPELQELRGLINALVSKLQKEDSTD